jgi:hypothetical protein
MAISANVQIAVALLDIPCLRLQNRHRICMPDRKFTLNGSWTAHLRRAHMTAPGNVQGIPMFSIASPASLSGGSGLR